MDQTPTTGMLAVQGPKAVELCQWLFDTDPGTLGEIYAYGVRNPQRFTWDPKNGNLFVADIGQNTVEEITIVTAGDNLGWNDWEAG